MSSEMLLSLGRIVYINFGEFAGSIAVVVDIVNAKKVVVHGPTTGVPKHVISTRRLELTKFLIPEVAKGVKQSELT